MDVFPTLFGINLGSGGDEVLLLRRRRDGRSSLPPSSLFGHPGLHGILWKTGPRDTEFM